LLQIGSNAATTMYKASLSAFPHLITRTPEPIP
jgi:hypothetical protein